MSTKGVQPSYALPVLGRNTSDCFRVNGIETPGNGLLVMQHSARAVLTITSRSYAQGRKVTYQDCSLAGRSRYF